MNTLQYGFSGEVTLDVLLDLYHKYIARNKRTSDATHWLMNGPTYRAVATMKMGSGLFVMTTDAKNPNIQRVLGIPVIVAEYAPDSVALIERLGV